MAKIELEKAYEPAKYEQGIYERWENSGFFNPDKLPGRRTVAYSISMPPPNVTGNLHIGHAVMLAIEDILIRYKRMQNYKTLWLPGVDHAAIATSARVEKVLYDEKGVTRHDLGRVEFLRQVESYVEKTRGTIISQIKKMGSSCDWSRMAYTLDEPRTKAVRTVFKKMYDDGLIYRGDRIVNWCPRCATTLADDEVEYKDETAKLYYIKYGPLIIATTRPETKIGDTAAAVNPEDQRYKKYVGKTLDVPLGKISIKVKVIADVGVDPKFGTGVVGVTPAHSQADFDMAERHGLEIKKVINEFGHMTREAGPYAGMTVAECRQALVKDLEAAGLIKKIEDYAHSLSLCYRCDTPVEPLTSKQWFIDVNIKVPGRGKSLKQMAIEVVREGDIKIIPDRFNKIYFHWMDNLRDWCISRQIWFGHQIPVWYKDDEIFVGVEEPKGKGWRQDPDTLDTWFSSGLWTFSTLGWPGKTKDLKTYHPTSVMETGYDILFFWIARMIIMSVYALGEVPFSNVYLHGLIRDEKGRKMSKSLGNVIDPVDVADKFGTDAVRLSLVIGTSPGNDMKLSEEKIAGFRNFTNKLWNISRYVLATVENPQRVQKAPKPNTLADAWILSRFARIKEEVEALLDGYQFSAAGEALRDFTWSEFADWYIEISKIEKDKDQIMMYLLERLLIMWHAFMPYVTEKIWSYIEPGELLMIQKWPEDQKKLISHKSEEEFNQIKDFVTKIRNIRSIYKIEPVTKIELLISAGRDVKKFQQYKDVIQAMVRASQITIAAKMDKPELCLVSVLDGVEAYIPTQGVIDLEKERDRLRAEAKDLERYISGVEAKVTNIEFLEKAPAEIIETEKQKMAQANEKLQRLKEQIKNL